MIKTEVYICESEYDKNIDEYRESIIESCSMAIKEEGVDGFLNISFSTKEDIQRLNHDFRNIDDVTDVLSFPANELCRPISVTGITCDMEVEDGMLFLGDIVICYDRAVEQAQDYGHSLKRELCFLALHGTLHLLGYDHIEPDDETVMYGRQNKVLDDLGIIR